jgi:hypothetical protein
MSLQLDTADVMPLGLNELARSLSHGSLFTKWVACVYSSTYIRGLIQSTGEGVSYRRPNFMMEWMTPPTS